jgi:pimeloyl-ACP methyl ester carboxylesterase
MVTETDLTMADGRTLHVYDSGTGDVPVFWQHGTPQLGTPPEPLLASGVRWVSHDRPGYGTSTPQPGRTVGSVAADVASVADALGIERFAVMGSSGGGPHSLACAALLPDRVVAAVSISGLAPYGADGLDWFAGMGPAGEAELKASLAGREALTAHLASAEFDAAIFTASDHRALAGDQAWVGRTAGRAMAGGLAPMVDDDLAYVAPWGFVPADVTAPCAHSAWLADHCPAAEFRPSPGDGHVSVLRHGEAALRWITDNWR